MSEMAEHPGFDPRAMYLSKTQTPGSAGSVPTVMPEKMFTGTLNLNIAK